MSRGVAGSPGSGQAPDKAGTAKSALSDQQRVWVREIAETIRKRRQSAKLRRHARHDSALDDQPMPNLQRDI
jgi:hypothetical protein